MQDMKADQGHLHFAFVSSNFTWGGSEELWSEAAAVLASRGHRVDVYKNRLSKNEGNVATLKRRGCRIVELASFPLLPNRLYSLVFAFAHHLSIGYQAVRLNICLRLRTRPDLIVISQGGNFDGWLLATVCRRLNLPYVLICQKATELYWPDDRFIGHVRAVYADALHSFFVSQHNHRLTELQIGRPVLRASVVRNPFKVRWDRPQKWPAASGAFKLACVGRLYAKEKGQDILLQVLAMEKWKKRPISVSFFGSGEQVQALAGMADYLGLQNVSFSGFSTDIPAVWAEHHALVLPSRAEGLPLVVVEAMLSGRVPIVTNVAGNPEVVDEGKTGFLADAPTVDAFDAAMERAWRRREEWEAIGAEAHARIKQNVPPDPASTLAEELTAVAAGRNFSSSAAGPERTSRAQDAERPELV